MDLLTQGLLGASLSSSVALKKRSYKISCVAGFLGGLLPDFDILIRSKSDPLLFLDFHRHFTHSIFFCPIGSVFLALLLYLIQKKTFKFSELYLYCFLGFLSHGLLDALTSYGTNLFWPFSNERISLNIISIIDPIYTLILFFSLAFFYFFKSKKIIKVGILCSIFYLFICFIKHERVEKIVYQIAEQKKHDIEKLLIKPTIGNNFLWRTIYLYNGIYHINVVYMPNFKRGYYIKGDTVRFIDKEKILPELGINSTQRNDILRFAKFSNEYIYFHPSYKNVIADLRYGKMPYDSESLWGIKYDIEKPNDHVKYLNLRNYEKSDYKKYWEMVKGNLD